MKKLLIIFMLLAAFPLLADHIVGGELRLSHTGNNRYNISLIQFWDGNNLIIPTNTTGGNRDNSAVIFIYNKRTRAYMDQVIAQYISTDDIPYQNKACAIFKSLHTSVGVYEGSISLSPQRYNDPDGYYMVWERCCRNSDITNIKEPQTNGITVYLEFPPVSISNSSPQFQIPNGQYICTNRDFTMNMSAIDSDGDELRYALVNPLRGHTSTRQSNGDNTVKSSYPEVEWSNGFSLQNVISGSKPLRIDQNGILYVNSNATGLFVFAIQCEEYRNGKKIGVVRREFQLMVIDCDDEAPDVPVVTVSDLPVTNITMCSVHAVTLAIKQESDWTYQWQKNGFNIPGATAPNVTVSDTGSYSVIKSYTKKCTRDTTSAPVRVRLQPPPPIEITSQESSICPNERMLLTGSINDPERFIYQWSHNNAVVASSINELVINQPGNYKLIAQDIESGCKSENSIYISPGELLVTLPDTITGNEGADISIQPDVFPDHGGNQFSWTTIADPGFSLSTKNISVSLAEDTEFTLDVSSSSGCLASSSVFVKILSPIYIPTAFTPDHDGINDTFQIFNAKDRVQAVTIYNRWGQVIFRSEGYKVPWDGTFQNAKVSAGSYPYIIQTNETIYKGELLIIR
ncbi:gliding motility-associated C-terminal domain-containing protein [Dyadobacter luteus]|uniref:Gliding motility-associated C-terminal domain-containing protein n=1 Tax=Dyadobacter luteus TaxID=2259619 RepID=A0A3D8YGY2_9BACT|nr:gliding motility-associated C-terminal domain-containing protein [Dyadobacter luteus]REA64054.1 gliding motility-associated C-terminal domain-containing protein [Dyadobacter luteus]